MSRTRFKNKLVEPIWRPHNQLIGDWDDGNLEANPPVGTVLVDSLSLNAGEYIVTLIVTNTGDFCGFNLEHRNAANTANINAQLFLLGGENNVLVVSIPIKFSLALDERIRVVTTTNPAPVTFIQASLFMAQVIG